MSLPPDDPAAAAAGEDVRPLPAIRSVPRGAPLDWLQRGWQDLLGTRFRGLFYGALFFGMGQAVVWIYATRWQLTMGMVAGFFLMGPFICAGVYDLSRQRQSGGPISLPASLMCWRRNPAAIAFFAIMLTFAMIVWARVSLIVFALASTTSFPTLQGVLGNIFSLANPTFILLWLAVGFVFASIVFAISVVSMPMLLDRDCDALTAVFCSVRSLLVNPLPMYLWAGLIVLIIGLSLVLAFVPLLVSAPLIGHASWHAYRDLVAA